MKRSIVTLLLVLSIATISITACGNKTSDNTEAVLAENSTETVAVTESEVANSQIESLPWLQLSSLETHPELRSAFEEYVGVTGTTGNKEGTLYTNPLTTQADQNITLLLAIKNQSFRGYLFAADTLTKFGEIAAENYTDVDADDVNAPYATINAYFELLPDQEEGQFDGDATISRAQAMALLMRATTPVNDAQAPEANDDFTSKVGETLYTNFAAPMDAYAYINTSTGLTESTFNTAMSKGEYIYLLANYYSQDYQAYMDNNGFKNNLYEDDSTTISTVSDAGDIFNDCCM